MLHVRAVRIPHTPGTAHRIQNFGGCEFRHGALEANIGSRLQRDVLIARELPQRFALENPA